MRNRVSSRNFCLGGGGEVERRRGHVFCTLIIICNRFSVFEGEIKHFGLYGIMLWGRGHLGRSLPCTSQGGGGRGVFPLMSHACTVGAMRYACTVVQATVTNECCISESPPKLHWGDFQ